jgi:predicted phosphodiesterase
MTGNASTQGPELSQQARRIAVFSDIHGNFHALQAVLKSIEDEGADLLICCGDIVGYGARPNECVEAVRRLKVPTIAGNHDHAALLLTDISNFNDIAKAAVIWTRDVLTEENAEYLRRLPLTITDNANNVFFVHASPKEPGQWNYILTMGEARTNFNYFTQQVCFIGHSHQPFIIENDSGNLVCPTKLEITIRPGRRYLVNVGSVGQPRDHNWRAAYCLWDLERQHLSIRRVEYDLAGSQNAIIQAGLPRELADRLGHGM